MGFGNADGGFGFWCNGIYEDLGLWESMYWDGFQLGFSRRSRGWIFEFWLAGELNLGLGYSKGSVGNGDLENWGFCGIQVRALVFGDEDGFGVMI